MDDDYSMGWQFGQEYAREEAKEAVIVWLRSCSEPLSNGRWFIELVYGANDTPESVAAEILASDPDA